MKFAEWFDRGYETLVSVSPPGAPGIREQDAGKCPARRNGLGNWYTPTGWTNYRADRTDFPVWEKWGANMGLTNKGQFFILDIDSYNDARAASIEATAKKLFGDAPRRVGNWPKRALLYRAAEPIPGFVMPYKEGEETHRVETIGLNKQLVVEGVHPKTGNPYEWDRDIPRFEDLPVVTREQVEKFIDILERNLPEAKRQNQALDTGATKDPETLKGKPDLVRDALARIPNGDSVGYDEYITMGQAVRGAFGPGFEDEAYDVWDEWARKSPKYDEAMNEKHWGTMHQSRALGAQFIYENAAKNGWDRVAEAYFEIVNPPVKDAVADMFDTADNIDTPARPKLRIELLTDEQLQSMPDPRWLIGRHIPETGFGIIFGDPGTYKSFLALDMGLSIAAGFKDWYGDPIAEDAGAVLYIAGEGAGAFKLRIQAWKKQNWVEGEMIPADRFRVVTASLNFMRHEDIADLLAVVEASGLKRIAMIIIDTVSRAIPGADENKQQDMSIFVKACDTLRDRTGAFILGIHHAAKSGDMRGSSVIPGGGDAIFRVERKKGQSYVRLTCTKQKDAPDQWHNSYRLNLVNLGGDVSSLAPVRVEEKEVEEAVCTDPIKDEIFAAITRDAGLGNHWSMAPRAISDGRKYAVHEIAKGWAVAEDVAVQWLDMWLTGPEPELQVAIVNSSSKRKGLIVIDRPIMDSVFE